MGPTETSFPVWDLMLMVSGATCPMGFPESGAGNPSIPGGIFPGLQVTSTGYEYDADVPEVSVLAYYVIAPGVVNPGDTVVVHFTYQAAADGVHGDYFLVRIVDGDVFHVPAQDRGLAMSLNSPKTVNFSYVAQTGGFGIQFIVGLSDLTDAFYLDNLEIRAHGAVVVTDLFEAGVYPGITGLSPSVVRVGLPPTHPRGTFGLEAGVVLEGTQSLGVTGGRYFQLYGQGASSGGVSGLVLTYADPNPLDPFFGQTQAMFQGGVYQGDYLGYDNGVAPACTEQGQALIAANNAGNADISGVWYLTLDAQCQDGQIVHTVAGNPAPPHAAGDPVSIASVMGAFQGYDFTTADGDLFNNIIGMTLGKAGVLMMSYGGNSAQLVGGYDKASGVFAGLVMGALPENGGPGVCVVTQGQFVAVIDGAVFVPPPP